MKSLQVVEQVFNELSLKYPALTTLLVDVCMKVYEALEDRDMLDQVVPYIQGFRHGMNYTIGMTAQEKAKVFEVLLELEIEAATLAANK